MDCSVVVVVVGTNTVLERMDFVVTAFLVESPG